MGLRRRNVILVSAGFLLRSFQKTQLRRRTEKRGVLRSVPKKHLQHPSNVHTQPKSRLQLREQETGSPLWGGRCGLSETPALPLGSVCSLCGSAAEGGRDSPCLYSRDHCPQCRRWCRRPAFGFPPFPAVAVQPGHWNYCKKNCKNDVKQL